MHYQAQKIEINFNNLVILSDIWTINLVRKWLTRLDFSHRFMINAYILENYKYDRCQFFFLILTGKSSKTFSEFLSFWLKLVWNLFLKFQAKLLANLRTVFEHWPCKIIIFIPAFSSIWKNRLKKSFCRVYFIIRKHFKCQCNFVYVFIFHNFVNFIFHENILI